MGEFGNGGELGGRAKKEGRGKRDDSWWPR